MKKPRVLFVCSYRGARGMIAEKLVEKLAPGKMEVYSAGFESGKIGKLPIVVMKEIGIDLPGEAPKSVFARYKNKEVFDYVITLCSTATKEQCPIFMTNVDVLYAREAKRFSWSIPDFMNIKGTEEEKKNEARNIRDQIKDKLIEFLSKLGIEVDES
ncbi:MAG: arsenate reductase ArsC [candidate division WOR-3 bacterium]|jgi:arsenate reductase (thioredoxin)